MRVFLYLLGLLGLFGFVGGCASRTVLGVGPLNVGGRVAVHNLKAPSVTVENGEELRFTVGPLSFGAIGSLDNKLDTLFTVDHSTGQTNVVDGQ